MFVKFVLVMVMLVGFFVLGLASGFDSGIKAHYKGEYQCVTALDEIVCKSTREKSK